MRIVFMGSADLACPCLEALARLPNHEVVAVVTQPDRPKGRDLKLSPPPVKVAAEQLGLAVQQPPSMKDPAAQEALRASRPDLIAVVAYGQILPRAVLDLPPRGCINVHASLLPRWRGASPIQHAILAGDAETGVTTMFLNEKMDEGDIILQRVEPIRTDDTSGTLYDRLAKIGAELLVEIVTGENLPRRPQDHSQATYARKLTKEDGRVNWTKPAIEIERMIRAFNPWPGAHTFSGELMLKLWRSEIVAIGKDLPGKVLDGFVVATGEGGLRVLEVQPSGKRRMGAAEFLRGHPQLVSMCLQ
ncbi:MAG: methionyl-tRNA formyltransferase [Verrucomicrobia bacterium]|nr:methionyl-tRNA formyltransferase [Verrucomicrobiota bacterium]